MILDENGLPEKYITLVEELGNDLGWSFEYGIDLRSIHRKIISSELTTKVIVLPNDNEFGTNGFCSIARSNLNYTRENFILNLDYYIDQGLLDQNTVNRDLYSTSNNYIGYYYNLNKYNREYDEITNSLL
jgi:phage minor structural protein